MGAQGMKVRANVTVACPNMPVLPLIKAAKHSCTGFSRTTFYSSRNLKGKVHIDYENIYA
jgi:hypothetical protein